MTQSERNQWIINEHWWNIDGNQWNRMETYVNKKLNGPTLNWIKLSLIEFNVLSFYWN